MTPPSFLSNLLSKIHSDEDVYQSYTDTCETGDVEREEDIDVEDQTYDSTKYELETSSKVSDENDEDEDVSDYQDESLDHEHEDGPQMGESIELDRKPSRKRMLQNHRKVLNEHFKHTFVCVRFTVQPDDNCVEVQLNVRTKNMRPGKRKMKMEREKRIQTILHLRTYVRDQFERMSFGKEEAACYEARLWDHYPVDPSHANYLSEKDQYKHAFLREKKSIQLTM